MASANNKIDKKKRNAFRDCEKSEGVLLLLSLLKNPLLDISIKI